MGVVADALNKVSMTDGTLWKGETDYTDVDELYSNMLPLNERALKKPRPGKSPSAAKCVNASLQNFHSIIVAQFMVPGWRMGWINNLLLIIIKGYSECENLYLHAVTGGTYVKERSCTTMCDGELAFIISIMTELGFECKTDGKETEDYCLWRWVMVRPGAIEYWVELYVHNDANKISVPNLVDQMHPRKHQAQVPNLRRVAVVSSPVDELEDGERADFKLNKALLEAMEKMKADAEAGANTAYGGFR